MATSLELGLGAAAAALYAYTAAADESAANMPTEPAAATAAARSKRPKPPPQPKKYDDEPPPVPRTKEQQRNYDKQLWNAREKLFQSERRAIPDIRLDKENAQHRLISAAASGTFNASASFGLGAASPVVQLIDEAAKQRRELEELNRKADRAKLVFGA